MVNTSPFLTKSHLPSNLAITIFISFAVSVQNSFHHHHFLFSLQSKHNYCHCLYHNLPKLVTRLQQIQKSLAHAVVKAPKSSHITPILRSPHCLKITECIEYKLLSLTYKVLTTTQPSYLHNFITV